MFRLPTVTTRTDTLFPNTTLFRSFEHGGEISPMLYDFYNTIFRQLQEANLRNSVKAIEDVILGLNNVRASWHELAERTNGTPQAVSAPPAAAAGSTSGAPPAPAGKSLAISI